MKPSSYLISTNFTENELSQTDYGQIYYNTPSETHFPTDETELSNLLKGFNRSKTPVTIRNTGHSMNGQTLTDGVQINVSKMKGIVVDKKMGYVTVKAGVSWDEMLQSINLPEYCTPIFPNNPGQEIRVGGQINVGGIGMYSSHRGGLWNYIKGLKVMAMDGKIHECSPEKNTELFRYVLGGYGRLGVVTEVTLKIEKSKPHVVLPVIFYNSEEDFLMNLKKILGDSRFSGAVPFHPVSDSHLLSAFHKVLSGIQLFVEHEQKNEIDDLPKYLEERYQPAFLRFVQLGQDRVTSLHKNPISIPKEDLVYWYTKRFNNNIDQGRISHLWVDLEVREADYLQVMSSIKELIKKYSFSEHFLKEPIHHAPDIKGLGAYIIKKPEVNIDFPLLLDLPDAEYSFSIGLCIVITAQDIEKGIAFVNEVTELAYRHHGKRYLYGIHNLTTSQLEAQYGRNILTRWNELKKQYDPNNLLNKDVINGLDSWSP